MITTKTNPALSNVFSVSLRLTDADRELVEQLFITLKDQGLCSTRSEFLRLALDELATRHADGLEVVQ